MTNLASKLTKAEWSNLSPQLKTNLITTLFNRTTKSSDKMNHPMKKPIGPGTVTPMYCVAEMTQCEMEKELLNGSGPYKFQLSQENVFDGYLSSHQTYDGEESGIITVTWKNCAVRTHDGDLYLAEVIPGQSIIELTMTGKEDCKIRHGKLLSGSWPLFLSVYTIPN